MSVDSPKVENVSEGLVDFGFDEVYMAFKIAQVKSGAPENASAASTITGALDASKKCSVENIKDLFMQGL
ncbi:hypothetical protein R80B4_02849 [Fibrobacteres bacterium R8-0-B4]